MSFSNTGPSPLLQNESFPWGAVHQECAAPTGYSSGLKIASVWAPCMGHESCQEPAPAWLSVGCSFLQGISSCSGLVFSMCLQGGYLLHCGLHQLQENKLHYHSLLYWLQWNFCSGACRNFAPSFFSDLGICRAGSLMFSHSLFSAAKQVFYPFLNMLSQRCTGVTCGFSLGQQQVCPTQGSFWSLPTEPTPAKTLP